MEGKKKRNRKKGGLSFIEESMESNFFQLKKVFIGRLVQMCDLIAKT